MEGATRATTSGLNFGDVIYLESQSGALLAADIFNALRWEFPQIIGKASLTQAPKDIHACLWVVCERLNYLDSEYASAASRRTSISNSRARSNSRTRSNSSGSLDAEEREQLEEQAVKEKERNMEELKKTMGTPVTYGQVVQLLHVASGRFLCSTSVAATLDKSCISLALDDGASTCYFRINPRYKVRTEGGLVLVQDEVIFSSVANAGFFVHESARADGAVFGEGNLSRDTANCAISIGRYFSHDVVHKEEFLKTGKPFLLWSPDNETFISAILQTGHDKMTTIMTGKRHEDAGTNLSNPKFFSSRSAWVVENVDPRDGCVIEWLEKYRIKHLATGKYLTVPETGKIIQSGTEHGFSYNGAVLEELYNASGEFDAQSSTRKKRQSSNYFHSNTFTVDENGVDDEEIAKDEVIFSIGLEDDLVRPEQLQRQLFSFEYVHKEGNFIPRDDVLVKVFTTLPNGAKLFLHLDFDKTNADKGDDESQKTGLACFTSIHHNYDALKIVRVKEKVERMVHFVSASIPVIRAYIKLILDNGHIGGLFGSGHILSENEETNELNVHRFDSEVFILGMTIKSSINLKFRDDSVDREKIMEIQGPANPAFQNCAREQGLLETIFDAVSAPSLLNILMDSSIAGHVDPRFNHISFVHALCWQAVKFLAQDNDETENMICNLKSKNRSLTALDRRKLLDGRRLGVDTAAELAGSNEAVDETGLQILISQVNFPVGASETLMDILNGNRDLLEKVVNQELIQSFIAIVKNEGPRDQFLDFYSCYLHL